MPATPPVSDLENTVRIATNALHLVSNQTVQVKEAARSYEAMQWLKGMVAALEADVKEARKAKAKPTKEG